MGAGAVQVAQRIAQLQEALLRCGKFQDALEPLLSWLADTEELISNQKPPSAEYKVVKAQIQEQKVSEHGMVVGLVCREGELWRTRLFWGSKTSLGVAGSYTALLFTQWLSCWFPTPRCGKQAAHLPTRAICMV